jgi:A/G-specific adenine glycosylase
MRPTFDPALRPELLRWFDENRRDLPWRRTRDPYAIWLSEVMLQQTQVATVIPYFERFLARFPSVRTLAAAPLDEVLTHWRGLGYYARARNLHRAAQAIVERHGGALPGDLDALADLPGFGRYTVGAVGSIAFGLPAPLVDGNVARVLSRLMCVEGAPGDKQREATLWELAGALVRGERPGDLNQALMELGAIVCRPEAPLCLLCPARAHCRALAQGRVDELPPRRVRPERKRLTVAAAVWREGESVLLGRRGARGLFGGLWELPTIELTGGELPRSLFGAKVRAFLGEVERTLTHRELRIQLYSLSGQPGEALDGYEALRWVPEGELSAVGISTAMQKAIALALSPAGDAAGSARRPGTSRRSRPTTSRAGSGTRSPRPRR